MTDILEVSMKNQIALLEDQNKEHKKVYIVILNWNGWKHTVECLESVFRNNYNNYKVIVCDNASEDNSITHIKNWASRREVILYNQYPKISKNTMPPLREKVSYVEYDWRMPRQEIQGNEEASLILIQTGSNRGFAGGNNIGIKYALQRDDLDYIWLLNNDTVIDEDALVELVKYYEESKNIGICGSKLLTYEENPKIQSLGGIYNKFFGTTKSVNKVSEIHLLSYISGASMLVSKKFLQEIGLMSEEYFLYYEEMDWSIRAKGKFRLGCAESSIVYHKEGATIGGKNDTRQRTELADYYSIRNRIFFTKKYFPMHLLTVYLGLLIAIINRIRRKQYNRVKMIVKIAIEFL